MRMPTLTIVALLAGTSLGHAQVEPTIPYTGHQGYVDAPWSRPQYVPPPAPSMVPPWTQMNPNAYPPGYRPHYYYQGEDD